MVLKSGASKWKRHSNPARTLHSANSMSFTGREIARILDIGMVHGKFYKRLKLAMESFRLIRPLSE